MDILNQVIIAYYSLDNDEVYAYCSNDSGGTFTDANNNLPAKEFISKALKEIKDPVSEDDKYYKIRACEHHKNVFECKCNVKTSDGGLYSFTTYSNLEILALEENKEKLNELLGMYS